MSLVELGWRKFSNFFDKTVVNDKTNKKFLGLKDVSVDSWSASGDTVFLGESRGGVFRLQRDLDEYFWRAYQTGLADLRAHGSYLFSIGEDEENVNSLLKIWDLEKLDKTSPEMKRSVKICQVAGTSVPCTTLAVHSDLNVIATGFADGTVVMYFGDIIKDKSLNIRWIRLRESAPAEGPITGLAIAKLKGVGQSGFIRYVIFVVTSKEIRSYVVENKQIVHQLKHDATGAARPCISFCERTNRLTIANQNMVYFYEAEHCLDPDGKMGRCHALGRANEKVQLVEAGGYVALLTKQPALISTAEAEWMSIVTVYDIPGQYIAFSCSLPSLCTMFVLQDTFMILGGRDGTLSLLTPKHLNAKLEILYRKNFYDVAISVAKRSDEAGANDRLPAIHAKYADYLYGKGDFENAMTQFKETIGTLEASYVIKKFLDGSKISQLCSYLEALHNKGVHNAHHTTILLNCYARLGDGRKIKQFIDHTPNHCDLEAAVQVLRTAKLGSQAIMLAAKNGMYGHCIAILIEDEEKYEKAVQFIGSRPVVESCRYLEEYGRTLLEKCPEQTMELLANTVVKGESDDVDPSKLLQVFIAEPGLSSNFIEVAMQKASGPSLLILQNTILELKMREYGKGNVPDKEILLDVMPLLTPENTEKALQVALIFDCPPVVQYIYRISDRKMELLQYLMNKKNLDEILTICEKDQNTDLWLDTLVFVSKCESEIEDTVVTRLLKGISASNCVHPLVVLEILSRSNTLKVSVVKDYVIKWLSEQEKQIEMDKMAISNNEKKMAEIEKHIEELNFNVQVLQVNKCRACGTALQLPAIHFLCKHSFHVNCFESYADQADVCPACTNTRGGQNGAQSEDPLSSRAAYKQFQEQLNKSVNGMSVVADYLKRGLFNRKDDEYDVVGSNMASPAMSQKKTVPPNPFEGDDSNPFNDSASSVRSYSRTTPRKHQNRGAFKYSPSPRKPSSVRSKGGNNPFEDASDGNPFDSSNPFDQPSNNPFDED